MARYNFLVVSLFCIALVLLSPSASRADLNYTFIQMTCDKLNKAVDIKVIYKWNEDGEQYIETRPKDTYYLPYIDGKRVTCDFGENRSIGFVASAKGLPKDNDMIFYLDNKYAHPENTGSKIWWGYSLGQGEWKIAFKQTGAENYDAKFCSNSLMLFQSYYREWADLKKHKPICEDMKFENAEIVQSHLEDKK